MIFNRTQQYDFLFKTILFSCLLVNSLYFISSRRFVMTNQIQILTQSELDTRTLLISSSFF